MSTLELTWKKDYSVGSEDLDDQHKRLIYIINEFSLYSEKNYRDAVLQLLNSLSNYTIYHFNYEEELFEREGYPATYEHKLLHRKFIDQLLNFREDYESGKTLSGEELVAFLRRWIVNHICHHDKEMMQWITNKHGW